MPTPIMQVLAFEQPLGGVVEIAVIFCAPGRRDSAAGV
jgi:hypothetical protein